MNVEATIWPKADWAQWVFVLKFSGETESALSCCLTHPKTHWEPPTPAWTKVYTQANTQARLCISVYTRSPRGFTILTPITFAITVSWELQTHPDVPWEAAEQSADEGAACVKRCSHFVICTRESTAHGNIFGQMFQHASLQNDQEQSICGKGLLTWPPYICSLLIGHKKQQLC